MSKIDISEPGSYLQYLPDIYQKDADKGTFISKYLKIFEKILSGIHDDVTVKDKDNQNVDVEGIEQIIERTYEFFDPDFTPYDFLKWLGKWVALTVSDDWNETAKRRLLKQIVPLYKIRGTKLGLSEYLTIFVGPNVEVDEFMQGITVGQTGTIGIDTFVGGLAPHFFVVTVTFRAIEEIGFVHRTVESTKSILDLEKPAHTRYALRFDFPGIIVGDPTKSTVGKNTIIGSKYPIFV